MTSLTKSMTLLPPCETKDTFSNILPNKFSSTFCLCFKFLLSTCLYLWLRAEQTLTMRDPHLLQSENILHKLRETKDETPVTKYSSKITTSRLCTIKLQHFSICFRAFLHTFTGLKLFHKINQNEHTRQTNYQ